ncbi:hypothetical protein SPPR111872_10070 [Sphingobacterium prati]
MKTKLKKNKCQKHIYINRIQLDFNFNKDSYIFRIRVIYAINTLDIMLITERVQYGKNLVEPQLILINLYEHSFGSERIRNFLL